ncbi:MAG TPA: DUF2971 domain-containing protein [Solirubrobacterales bacterium]|nr:DUF2971 domain-containing protein [Solirubrobacterales bacterium]
MSELTPEQLHHRQQELQVRQRFVDARAGSEQLTAMSSSPPRRLYHYTSLRGLMGICSSTEIWASDVRFVNDASELTYASELIGTEVAAAINDSKRIAQHVHLHPDIANPFQVVRPFIACFCEEADLLSQWRGYGARESAYSLGFDLDQIANFGASPRNTVVQKVVYDPEQQRGAVRLAMQIWIATAETILDEGQLEPSDLFPYPAIGALQDALIEHHLCFKNPAFAEEKEWRLIKIVDLNEELGLIDDQRRKARWLETKRQVEEFNPEGAPFEIPSLPARGAEGLEICFRRSAATLVPYVRVPLQDAAGVFTGLLPLWEVIQGPCPDPALSLESLELYLRSVGYGVHTEIQTSQVPLRT